MAERPALLRAKEGFLVPALRLTIKGGQVVPADHPVVKGREHLFEAADTGIERATRAPGEMRVTGRMPDSVVSTSKAVPKQRRKPTA
jgi:hypothetical protein